MSRFSQRHIDYSRPLCAGCGKIHRGSCRAFCSRCRVSGHSRVYCPGGTTGGVVNVSGTSSSCHYGFDARREQRRDRKKKRRNRRREREDDAVEVKQEGGKVDEEVVEIKKEVKE